MLFPPIEYDLDKSRTGTTKAKLSLPRRFSEYMQQSGTTRQSQGLRVDQESKGQPSQALPSYERRGPKGPSKPAISRTSEKLKYNFSSNRQLSISQAPQTQPSVHAQSSRHDQIDLSRPLVACDSCTNRTRSKFDYSSHGVPTQEPSIRSLGSIAMDRRPPRETGVQRLDHQSLRGASLTIPRSLD